MKKLTSIGKALQVLKLLSKAPYRFSVSQISQKTLINRTTVHRILCELEIVSFVVQSNRDKKYEIAPGLFHLASSFLYKNSNFDEIKSIIDELSVMTKQNVGFSIIENDQIINLYDTELKSPMKIMYRQGTYFPYHCGAYGKSIMAFYKPLDKLESLIRNTTLERRTAHTIIDPDLLLEEFVRIRKCGYALSDEENLLGAYGVGAPVFDSKGDVYGSIALAAVKIKITEQDIERYITLMLEGAKQVSKYIL